MRNELSWFAAIVGTILLTAIFIVLAGSYSGPLPSAVSGGGPSVNADWTEPPGYGEHDRACPGNQECGPVLTMAPHGPTQAVVTPLPSE